MDISPLIYQMCAVRLAQSDNPAAARILAQLNSSDGPTPDVRELVQAMAGQDPTVQLIMQQLDTMRAARETEGVTIDGEAEQPESELSDPREEVMRELNTQVEAMYRELTALRQRNENL